jgi:putative transposon-encoded protein
MIYTTAYIFLRIYYVYPIMRKIRIEKKTKLIVEGIDGFIKRKVTPFGNSAKVDCPKEYLGRDVYLVIQKPAP